MELINSHTPQRASCAGSLKMGMTGLPTQPINNQTSFVYYLADHGWFRLGCWRSMGLLDFTVSASTVESTGYLAALLVFLTFYTKTMLPLRYLAIVSNVAFIIYAALAQLSPILLLHTVLLPLNLYRVRQLRQLLADVEKAANEDLSLNWLLPYMSKRQAKADKYLFHGGEKADGMYYIARGVVALPEVGVKRLAGDIIGEIGLFSPGRRRTTSARCETDCDFFFISDKQVLNLYHQNPKFGIYLLRLIVARFVRKVDRLKEHR